MAPFTSIKRAREFWNRSNSALKDSSRFFEEAPSHATALCVAVSLALGLIVGGLARYHGGWGMPRATTLICGRG
jgi:hypothetical protein